MRIFDLLLIYYLTVVGVISGIALLGGALAALFHFAGSDLGFFTITLGTLSSVAAYAYLVHRKVL